MPSRAPFPSRSFRRRTPELAADTADGTAPRRSRRLDSAAATRGHVRSRGRGRVFRFRADRPTHPHSALRPQPRTRPGRASAAGTPRSRGTVDGASHSLSRCGPGTRPWNSEGNGLRMHKTDKLPRIRIPWNLPGSGTPACPQAGQRCSSTDGTTGLRTRAKGVSPGMAPALDTGGSRVSHGPSRPFHGPQRPPARLGVESEF